MRTGVAIGTAVYYACVSEQRHRPSMVDWSIMTITDYFLRVQAVFLYTDERWGQACFNVLWEYRPDLAEQIRGTDLDPFYKGEGNLDFWPAFYNFLTENLDSNE